MHRAMLRAKGEVQAREKGHGGRAPARLSVASTVAGALDSKPRANISHYRRCQRLASCRGGPLAGRGGKVGR